MTKVIYEYPILLNRLNHIHTNPHMMQLLLPACIPDYALGLVRFGCRFGQEKEIFDHEHPMAEYIEKGGGHPPEP